ncbi:hypothetical protein AVEN_198892-1 [Araneus ventricosus]|uniref:Uncharacterized protein n=1 Tax=Araneus ventricosus TaxID=182803 RepID=A0A4Y2DS37_ARAVE|nr:hypothetical protein AVEN_198892-1 [Araneus ventricosus]
MSIEPFFFTFSLQLWLQGSCPVCPGVGPLLLLRFKFKKNDFSKDVYRHFGSLFLNLGFAQTRVLNFEKVTNKRESISANEKVPKDILDEIQEVLLDCNLNNHRIKYGANLTSEQTEA